MLSCSVGVNFHGDLRIPRRFPATEATRDSWACEERFLEAGWPMDAVVAAQRAQTAAAGYAADYQCKRRAPFF
eukprot:2439255-Pyramimonas_sp.AAC.1